MDLTRSRNAHAAHAHSLSPALKVEHHGESLTLQIERPAPLVTVRLDFEKSTFLNHLRYDSQLHVLADISWSDDGKRFYRLHGLRHESHGDVREFYFPLVEAKHLQVNLYQEGGPVHKSELRRFQVGFISRVKLSAGSEFDRLWTAENLIDRREDYGWASMAREKDEPDFVQVDLGGLFFVSELQMKAVKDEYNFFPQTFQLQLSEDGAVWQTVQSEDRFLAASGVWHAWSFAPVRAAHMRVQIDRHAHYKKNEYQSKILDLAIIAVSEPRQNAAQGSSTSRMASENVSGSVLLAANNIAAPNRVVQSNDSRLRNASTEYKGIMQFARDNEVTQEKAVQSNDSRLRAATETSPGIVQLAKNGENRAQTAVQGNDARLNHATQDSYGITQLAKDGEARAGVALQASDSRIKPATTEKHGTVMLAGDGETTQGKAVQGNDTRLRAGTQSWPGILQLAAHGEIASAKAVAADDPRLIEADENKKGRVQFARKGESADLKAVQASDQRLQNASEESRGVVQFARNGVAAAGQAVQATDTRLTDAREAKPHTHSEYARHEHEFNSHSGNLHLRRASKTVQPDAITPSFDTNLPLLVENSEGLAASFTGGVVLSADGTASYHVSKTSPAIQASSRDQSAATLISANAYALHLPRSLPGLKGSEKALHAEGHVQIDGSINLKGGAAVTVALPRASNEAFVDGDLVAIENGVAAKMRNDNQVCVGVVVKSGALQLESGAVAVRVAVAGIVSLRTYGIVKAGDRLVLNSSQPGTCKPGQGSEKVVAIALEAANSDREKQVTGILVR